jgi:hypothetical protein
MTLESLLSEAADEVDSSVAVLTRRFASDGAWPPAGAALFSWVARLSMVTPFSVAVLLSAGGVSMAGSSGKGSVAWIEVVVGVVAGTAGRL